ncbi:MAG: 4-hydroxy-tetrahydrodipicolinate reductase, partial [Lachnospiraceae bacterium]|nr:4-hydroxy-tetrahydrodipicolinate reductase [Lachnospiraceae bacterium]
EEEHGAVEDAAKKIPVFYSANMSLGIALLKKLAKEAAAMFPGADIEIVEMHHRNKLDAPSGTALAIADAVKTVRTDASYVCGRSGFGKRTDSEIGIHAVRMGSEVGTHEVFFSTGNETVVLRHEAKDRGLFADGALSAAVWLAGQGPGLYGMEDLLG